jgi:hypothetical protein
MTRFETRLGYSIGDQFDSKDIIKRVVI